MWGRCTGPDRRTSSIALGTAVTHTYSFHVNTPHFILLKPHRSQIFTSAHYPVPFEKHRLDNHNWVFPSPRSSTSWAGWSEVTVPNYLWRTRTTAFLSCLIALLDLIWSNYGQWMDICGVQRVTQALERLQFSNNMHFPHADSKYMCKDSGIKVPWMGPEPLQGCWWLCGWKSFWMSEEDL